MLKCGDAFLTGDGDDDNFHLWIIITPPSEGLVITVCVVTALKRSERLVVLKPGDHPFIRRESVIAYYYSKIRQVSDIEASLKARSATMRAPVSTELLQRIQTALLESEHTPNEVRHYYNELSR